jgi:nickel transport protein
MVNRRIPALLLALAWLTLPAHAHKLSIFAYADGMTVRGEVYYTPGGPVKQGAITVFGPGGDTLHTLETDGEGVFAFEAGDAVDHRIVCETADGHQTEFTLKAVELRGPAPDTATPEPAAVAEAPVAAPAEAPTEAPAPPPAVTELDARIAEAVRREVVPLREALDAQARDTRLRDVLGGIGYIVGFAGLLALVKSRRAPEGR